MPNLEATPEEATASQKLGKFLEENGIEIRLTAPIVRQVDGGGVLVEQPQVVANYKQVNSIKAN